MPEHSSPEMPDTPGKPGSATVVQHGTPPRELLGSTDPGDGPDPLPDSAGNERYELLGVIARGGMGVVYRAHDRVLNREVGVKTLLKIPAEGGAAAVRFCEEARITAQLQHPNVPPVHDLGLFPDGRPYLAMKLIRGKTLDAILRDRPDPAHERGKFVAVFEQVAQGVAYAHAHRIIHRDLKPLNVMVGEYGEVQVMDWGLAKVLAEASARTEIVPTLGGGTGGLHGSHDDSSETRTGSVLGTPAYMPREQAVGAVDQIDTRSDVFSLGGILCTILTGRPPYSGNEFESTRQLAAVARLDEPFARLDASGAEPEMVALCKRCLAPERDDRPRDAGEVAKAVADLRAAAERRARQAELDRATAEAHAAEQRKLRKVQLALAAAVTLLLLGGGAFAWWQDRQAAGRKLEQQRADAELKATEARLETQREAERLAAEAERKRIQARLEGERDAESRNKAEQARQGVRADRALADDLRRTYRFAAAEAALAQAAKLAAGGAPELVPEVEQARADLAFVVALDDIRSRKWLWVNEIGSKGYFNTRIAAPEYRRAFADRGLNLAALAPAEAAKRIAASPVRAELVAAVDDWALYEPDAAVRNRLLEVTRRADPGEWVNRLRDPAVRRDPAAVSRLAADADLERTPSAAITVLATLMERHKQDPTPLLTAARVRHPSDFELAFAIGQWHTAHDGAGKQIGAYEAAHALRPENTTVGNNLAIALADRGEWDAAIALLNSVLARDPGYATAHFNLGNVYFDKGELDKAVAEWKEAIARYPHYATAYANWGAVLAKQNKLDEALGAFKTAIEFDPERATLCYNLGLTYKRMRRLNDAITWYKAALRLDPKLGRVHNNLGLAFHEKGQFDEAIALYKEAVALDPKDGFAYFNWGLTLESKGDREGALDAWRKAAAADPKVAVVHYNIGSALAERGDIDGAIAAWREAVKQNPKYAAAYTNLGVSLAQKGLLEDSIAALREAVKHDPKLIPAHMNLAIALQRKGDVDGAIEVFKEAVKHNPGYAAGHYDLGNLYLRRKKYPEAIAAARAAVKVQPKFAAGHALLADALLQSGDPAAAREALAEAARLDRRYEPWLAKIPERPVAPPPREVKRP